MIILNLLRWLNFPSLGLVSFEKLNDHYIRKQVKFHTDSAKVVISPNPFYKWALDFRCGLGRKKERKREKAKQGLGLGSREKERRTMSFMGMTYFFWKYSIQKCLSTDPCLKIKTNKQTNKSD